MFVPFLPLLLLLLLQELNKVDPLAVIQRFESEQFASNEACLKEYISALARVERLDKIMPTLSASMSGWWSFLHGTESLNMNSQCPFFPR